MGHYNESSKGSLTGQSEHAQVYQSYKNHCSAERIDTDFEITVAIRERHPDAHVTTADPNECDLLGFAKAGHLKATLRTEGDKFLAKRIYSPPATRLEGGDGTLGEKVDFGYFEAEYEDQAFSFYSIRWKNEVFGRRYWNFYILSPKSSVDSAGHSTFADSLVLATSKWTVELHDEIYVYDSADWTKSSHLWQAVQKSTWDDVIMDPKVKETLISDVQNFFDSRSLYEEYAVPWKRGVIFHGTPGCGKTISIKALMNALDKRSQPVVSLYVKTFTTACPGEEYSIREIFQKARVMAPCMLVFEDLDSLVKDKIRSYFLNEVDGLEDNNGILMVGSTNHLDRLDPGIAKRPSRFDRKYHFKIPGYKERILYCEYWKKKLEQNSKIDFDPAISDVVARLTEGFSFAYLKELFVQTLLTIVGGRDGEVGDAEVENAAEESKVVSGSASLVVGEGKVDSNSDEGKKDDHVKGAPRVDIPEGLKSNPLMRVLHKQSIALWKDMDNTNDPEAGVKAEASEGKDGEDDDNNEGPIRDVR
jgi:AAA+ superfamily predicted ATPase